MKLRELAQRIGAQLQGDAPAALDLTGVASPRRATAGSVVFAETEAGAREAGASPAGAVILRPDLADRAEGKPLLLAANPKLAFARAAEALRPASVSSGVHPTAQLGLDLVSGEGVAIGAYAVIGDGVRIGDRTSIGAGCVVGNRVSIGPECRIHPRVVIYPGVSLGARVVVHAGTVLGSDGFGYVRDEADGRYLQFPQQGALVIEDDVEIGANATLDRGALDETRIARGTKIDNLVHVAHNVVLGQDVVIAAQTGISGSSVIGRGAIIGGQVGIADHVTIGEGVILGAQAGVPSGKKLRGAGIVFWGTPARPLKAYLRELAALARIVRSGKGE